MSNEDVTLVIPWKSQMMKRLDPHTLANVVSEEGGPIIRWDDNCPIHAANSLSNVDCCRTVHNIGEIS